MSHKLVKFLGEYYFTKMKAKEYKEKRKTMVEIKRKLHSQEDLLDFIGKE